jgi:hypothetical protein
MLSDVSRARSGWNPDILTYKVETYQKNSLPFLRAEAQLSVVEAASKPQQRLIHKDDQQGLEDMIQAWCGEIMSLEIGVSP